MGNVENQERYRQKMREKGWVKASIWIDKKLLKELDKLKPRYGQRNDVISAALKALRKPRRIRR